MPAPRTRSSSAWNRGRAPGDDRPGRPALEAIDEQLWRNRTPPQSVVGNHDLPPEVGPLFLLTEMLAATVPQGGDGCGEEAERLHSLVDLYAEELLDRMPVAARAPGR